MKIVRSYYINAEIVQKFSKACKSMKQTMSQVVEELMKRYAEQINDS